MSDCNNRSKVGNSLSSILSGLLQLVCYREAFLVSFFLLFLLNDIENAARELLKVIFADDTTGLIKAKDIQTLGQCGQSSN